MISLFYQLPSPCNRYNEMCHDLDETVANRKYREFLQRYTKWRMAKTEGAALFVIEIYAKFQLEIPRNCNKDVLKRVRSTLSESFLQITREMTALYYLQAKKKHANFIL